MDRIWFSILDGINLSQGNYQITYTQDLYAIEGRYAFNRYFDFGGNLLLPKGDSEFSSVYSLMGRSSSMSPQLSLLMGMTPFHFTVFGAQFMELGLDLGILATDSAYTNGGNIKPMIGPRLGFNFGQSVALIFAGRAVTSGNDEQWYSTMSMAYRW